MIGPGHRALWWSSTEWEYGTAFSDFYGTIDPPYTGQHPRLDANTRSTGQFAFRQSPVAAFARTMFTKGFASVPPPVHRLLPNLAVAAVRVLVLCGLLSG